MSFLLQFRMLAMLSFDIFSTATCLFTDASSQPPCSSDKFSIIRVAASLMKCFLGDVHDKFLFSIFDFMHRVVLRLVGDDCIVP